MTPFRKHRIGWLTTLLLVVALTSLDLGIRFVQPVAAQNAFQRVLSRFFSRSTQDERPASLGRGGANRDRCPFLEQELIALAPFAKDTNIAYEEKTVSAYPSWYFYVPYLPQAGRQLEFVLVDSGEAILYQETFPLIDTPSIVKFSLPQNIPGLTDGLEPDQDYRWVFSVICNAANRSGDATVNGWIERMSVDAVGDGSGTMLPDEMSEGSGRDRYLAYADNLLWFDALDALVTHRERNPDDPGIEADWQTLLDIMELSTLDNSSIILLESASNETSL